MACEQMVNPDDIHNMTTTQLEESSPRTDPGSHVCAITRLKKSEFLRVFVEAANVTTAAQIVGITRKTHYNWMRDDPEYARDFEDARAAAADLLEAEARRRAVEGVEEPVYQGGEMVGSIRRYSDTLLIALLRANRPEKYCNQARTVIGTQNIQRNNLQVNQQNNTGGRLSPPRQRDWDEWMRIIIGAGSVTLDRGDNGDNGHGGCADGDGNAQ